MTEVVLCRPGIEHLSESNWSHLPPLGLGYIAATLRKFDIEVGVVDAKMLLHTDADKTVNQILDLSPTILGLSAMTFDYHLAVEIAIKIKKASPDMVVVIGGAHVNALPKESLMECSEIDYAIVGEAELSFTRFCKTILSGGLDYGIPGLFFRDSTGAILNQCEATWKTKLDELPYPAWDLFPRTAFYPIMWNRGCPFRCVFCSRNMKQHVRTRAYQHVFQEIDWLVKTFNPVTISFQDETFGLYRNETCNLLERLSIYNEILNRRVKFTAQTRVDCVDEKLLRLMKASNFDLLELGIESGNSEILKSSGKDIILSRAVDAVRLTHKVGLRVWLKFIIGLPGETRKTIWETIWLAAKLNPHRLSVSVIVAYPGSQIYRWALNGENGYKLISKEWRHFDKYLTKSLELHTLSHAQMQRYQVLMYLIVYLLNLRVIELGKLLWHARRIIERIIVNQLSFVQPEKAASGADLSREKQ